MVMGTVRASRRVNALKGTWPPFGNTADDWIGPEPGAIAPLCAAPAADRLACAAAKELVGPLLAEAEVPPATRALAALAELAAAPVRKNRSCKLSGLFSNRGFTSSTT